ncbi:MAG: heme o synthase [Planctomycetota bacterium]|nr:heme o synthase [Planctomycetota bacterium]
MTASVLTYESRRQAIFVRAGHFIELTKPKIAALELVTVVVAAIIASSGVPTNVWLVVHAVIGTVLVAASASAFNQLLERESDRLMIRTAERPLPAGYVSPREAFCFAMATFVLGTVYLVAMVNWVTATLGVATWLLYVAVYTPLKSRTTANTLVGAVAGAGPVLMGWTAVQPRFSTAEDALLAATLFVIVFLWQFPHFMAIAWIYRDQYKSVGSQMLTVVDATGRLAGKQAVWAAAVLVPVSLYPAIIMRTGPLYFGLALLLSAVQLWIAGSFMVSPSDQSARRLLRCSLIYLPALLGLLIVTPFVFPWL